jgi:hypothetical protein
MSDRIRFIFDQAVQESLSTEDIVRLSESLQSFIEYGIIDCEDGEEFYIDTKYLQNLITSITAIQKASKKYSRDDNGLVKYPFNIGDTDGN